MLGYITFEQFVYTVDICDYYTNLRHEECKDNQVIRIYCDVDGKRNEHDLYIDIGWDDYCAKVEVWDTLTKTLSKNILDSKVTDICYDEKFGVLTLYLSLNPEESLEQYQN